MNNRITHTIYKSEQMYEKRKTPNTAFLLILRYLEGSLILADKNKYLQKAMYITKNNGLIDITDIKFKLLEVYINMALEQYEEAENTLNKLMNFKRYHKNTGSYEYAVMLLLSFNNEFVKGHNRRAQKYYKSFSGYIQSVENNNSLRLFESILLRKHMVDYGLSNSIIVDLSNKGCRSPLLYIEIYDMLLMENEFKNINAIINKTIVWGITQGFENHSVITKLENYFKENIMNTEHCSKAIELMYYKYSTNKTLNTLCELYIKQLRVDKKALEIYVKAKAELRHIEKLDIVYSKAAYKNDYEKLEPQSVQNIISEDELENDLKAFLYYLVLTNTSMRHILKPNSDKIVKFGEACFKNKLNGVYYNTIYKYMFEQNPDNEKLQKYIAEKLFSYEITITNTDIKYIWISEQEKSEIQAYVVKSDTVTVNASSSDFTIYALGQRQRSFYNIENNLKIKKQIIFSDKNIYNLLWNKGFTSIDTAINIAKKYIDGQFLTSEGAEILKSILEYTGLTDDFRVSISVMLGRFFANKRDYNRASGYFSLLNKGLMNNSELESAIITFTEVNDIEKALMIFRTDKTNVSDNAKLYICLAAIKNNVYEKEISYISAELILKGRSEKELIENVIHYYDAPLIDWINIKKMLDTLKINTDDIDDKIIEKALYTQQVNEKIEDIFIKKYKKHESNETIKEFIEYVVYTIITKEKTVETSMLYCLENEYLKNRDEYICYAIASVYIMNNMEINTDRYDIIKRAIAFMESKNIMLPIFKKYKDKIHENSYLERNKPFVYTTLPNREVYINYKIDNDPEFHKEKMTYGRFGLYMLVITLFYNEVLEYYIEESGINAVNETIKIIHKDNLNIVEDSTDEYYEINNAIVYAETLNYGEVEKIILDKQKKKNIIRSVGHII